MLGIMRKYKQSIVIKAVFALIVFSFIGTIFLVWGKGDKGFSGTDYAARIGKLKVPYDEYERYLYRLRNMYSQVSGRSVTPEMEKQLGLKKMAVDFLIDKVLMLREADKMGIEASKDEVSKEIASIPAFQRNGAFDFNIYQQILRSQRLTPANFEESVKEELLVKKLRQKIMERATVSDDEALQKFRKQNDKVDLFYATVSPADVKGEVKLTDQDLNAYIQGHQEQFKTPERISLSYLVVDPDKIAARLSVTDEEVQTYYQKHIDSFQGKDGFLPLSEVKERAKAMALRAKAAQEAYAQAADAINKNLKNADLNSAAKALGVKIEETPLFTMAAPPAQLAGEKEVVKRAFPLKGSELGGPIETAKGIYIIKIKEREPAAVPPLATIRARVEPLAAEDKARQLAQKKAMDILGALSSGKGAPKLQETGEFAYSPKGEIPKIGIAPDVMEAAFNLTATAPVAKSPFKVGDRWYVIKLKNRVELNKEEFPKQKELIKQALLPQKQQEVLSQWMKDLRGKVKIEINPAITAND